MAIAVAGLFFLYSATFEPGKSSYEIHNLVIRQCIWIGVGFLVLFSVAHMDYIRVLDFSYLAYFINLLMLAYLLLFGGERYGAKRWIDVGFFSLQPSEFVKITMIFALSTFLGQRRDRAGSLDNFIYAMLVVAPAFILIFLQPDLGTALILVPILFAILLVSGENIKYMIVTFLAGIASMPIAWHFLKGYQRNRLMVFINPNADPLGSGYTIIQSKIAIGSGGLTGKGWLNGTQNYLKFLPEKHTDFIFSTIGEEWGFIGALALVGLFSFVIARGVRIISETDDVYGKAIATGIVTLLSFQVLVNISMTIGLMPVVGIPLPLISYGGSNVLATLIGIGLLLSVSRRRYR